MNTFRFIAIFFILCIGSFVFPPERVEACVVDMGSACDSPFTNACGEPGSGYVQCDGSCDAVVPPETDVCPGDPGLQCTVGECSPMCVPSVGAACSASNSCGMTNHGSVQCDGSCSVGPPSDALCNPCVPTVGALCSASNSCGMTGYGSIQCDGSCPAVAPSDSFCASVCSNGSPGPYPACPICTPDPSCAAGTCIGDTCYDSCSNAYSGTMFCGGGPSAPAPNLLVNSSNGPISVTAGTNLNITWGNVADATSCSGTGTGWTGTKTITGGSDTIPATLTSTYTITCTGPGGSGSDSVTVNLGDSLKICESSCSSGLLRSGQNFSMASGSTRNLVACYNSANDCSNPSGNVTALSTWTEGGNPTISLSGTNPKTVTASTGGTENITATYSP